LQQPRPRTRRTQSAYRKDVDTTRQAAALFDEGSWPEDREPRFEPTAVEIRNELEKLAFGAAMSPIVVVDEVEDSDW
jgi:hypothetical protein